ncbi:MAG: CoA-binding protein [Nonlabens sp.]
MNKQTLVLGASLKENRYSNIAIHRLRKYHVPVVAIGLRKGIVADVEICNETQEFENVHTVTLYLNPKRQEPYFDYVISLAPQRVIFNPGTENPEFYELLKRNDIEIAVACTLVMLGTGQY